MSTQEERVRRGREGGGVFSQHPQDHTPSFFMPIAMWGRWSEIIRPQKQVYRGKQPVWMSQHLASHYFSQKQVRSLPSGGSGTVACPILYTALHIFDQQHETVGNPLLPLLFSCLIQPPFCEAQVLITNKHFTWTSLTWIRKERVEQVFLTHIKWRLDESFHATTC